MSLMCAAVGFWLCGVLLGAFLCFKTDLGLIGLWVGIASGDTITGGMRTLSAVCFTCKFAVLTV